METEPLTQDDVEKLLSIIEKMPPEDALVVRRVVFALSKDLERHHGMRIGFQSYLDSTKKVFGR